MTIKNHHAGRKRYSGLLALILAAGFFILSSAKAQESDILLKGGHVIDPKNNIDAKMDVAITGGKISRVAAGIPASSSKRVVDVSGLYITPGLIDIHTHVFVGSNVGKFANGPSSVKPDDFAPRAGVTTVVDAGTSGWRNFDTFKSQVMDISRTRVLAFINTFGTGMIGGKAEQDTTDMDLQKVTGLIKNNPDRIVGIKIGHYNGGYWAPFDRALEMGRVSDRPVFVECHIMDLSLEDQLARMRPGDIITHAFEKVNERMPVVDEDGNVRPFVIEARKRGILFDVGHGGAGFWFSQGIPALKKGFGPDSFGTDMHHNSVNAGMKDMLNLMSKYLNMGMDFKEVIKHATWAPANAIKRPDLGNLSEGAEADIAVLRIREGNFGFVDAGGFRLDGDQKLEAELTIRAGRIVWDLNGISAKKINYTDY